MITGEGLDRAALETAIATWVLTGTGLPVGQVFWIDQDGAARPPAPAIGLRLTSENDASLPWVDIMDNWLVLAPVTGTLSATGTAFLVASHPFKTGDGPVDVTGHVVGKYWIVKVDTDHFALSTTFANSMSSSPVVGTFTAGSITVSTLDAMTERVGEEILMVSRSIDRLILTLECWATNGVSEDAAMSFLRRLISRSVLPGMQDILFDARIGLTQFDRVRFTKGRRDAVRVEPRAYLEVRMNCPAEAYETMSRIASVQATNLTTGTTFDVSDGSGEP